MLYPGPKPRPMMNNVNVQWYGNVDMAMHIYLINFQLISLFGGDELTNWIFDLATSWPAVLGDEMTRATSWPVINWCSVELEEEYDWV